MAIPLALVALGKFLMANGLPLLANAVVSKGKEYIEEKTGIKLPDPASSVPPEQLLELKKAEFAHEEFLVKAALDEKGQVIDWMKTESQEVTKRWTADMMSDSWLSKNIRPLALGFLLALLFVCIAVSWAEITTPDSLLALLKSWGEIVLVAYFGGRTIEKGVAIAKGGKRES